MSSRSPAIHTSPELADSKPAMMRSSVVLPEPLSPRMVRNSPSATSREILLSTTCLPNCLETERMLRRGALSSSGWVSAAIVLNRESPTPSGHADKSVRATQAQQLLRRLHFVPDFAVLGAARDVLPEVDALLIFVHVVEMQALLLLRAHELRRFRIRRRIASHIGHFLLRLRLDHVLEKFVRQLFILATRRNHQVINPTGSVFFGNGLANRKARLAQLIGHQRPSHGRDYFVVFE